MHAEANAILQGLNIPAGMPSASASATVLNEITVDTVKDLAIVAASLSVWEREKSIATGAERRTRFEELAGFVRSTAPSFDSKQIDACVGQFRIQLTAAGIKAVSSRCSDFRLLLKNPTLFPDAKGWNGAVKAIRTALGSGGDPKAAILKRLAEIIESRRELNSEEDDLRSQLSELDALANMEQASGNVLTAVK